MKLKKLYSSREVAVLTGLTARQLRWWDARRLYAPAVASHRTDAGGFTERRYTPLDVLELQALADLRRRGFSIPRLRRLLSTLRELFGVRLYEAVGEGGTVTLLVSGQALYARAADGRLFDLEVPAQPLLMPEDGMGLRVFVPRERRPRTPALRRTSESGTPSRRRRPDGE
jgi:DNA-binding transcriptional MerR regulator